MFLDNPRKRRHWEKHKSAQTLAEFVMQRDGLVDLESSVAQVTGQRVRFEKAVIEEEVPFDSYGHGREHDLGIYGYLQSGESLFIGLEAKVNETFRETARDAYLNAKAMQLKGDKTNVPKRIEQLLQRQVKVMDRQMFNIRYQFEFFMERIGAERRDSDLAVWDAEVDGSSLITVYRTTPWT